KDDLNETVQSVFAANFPPGAFDAVVDNPSVEPNLDTQSLKVSVTATLPTTLLRVIGKDRLQVHASSTTQSESGRGMELALVLDTTGSMSGSKIAALKSASRDLVDVIYEIGRASCRQRW